jgi:hypothetical protein
MIGINHGSFIEAYAMTQTHQDFPALSEYSATHGAYLAHSHFQHLNKVGCGILSAFSVKI